jgi:glycerol uptake facilitator-like aquaporin
VFSKLTAEFIGTFWLVLGGCGSAVMAAAFPDVGIGLLGVSLAFGLRVLSAAYALGPISGGHFNPAVSVGLWAGGRFPAALLLSYTVAQVLGGVVAAGTATAVIVGDWALQQLWLFWLAPVIGAAIAGFAYKSVLEGEGHEPPVTGRTIHTSREAPAKSAHV